MFAGACDGIAKFSTHLCPVSQPSDMSFSFAQTGHVEGGSANRNLGLFSSELGAILSRPV